MILSKIELKTDTKVLTVNNIIFFLGKYFFRLKNFLSENPAYKKNYKRSSMKAT